MSVSVQEYASSGLTLKSQVLYKTINNDTQEAAYGSSATPRS